MPNKPRNSCSKPPVVADLSDSGTPVAGSRPKWRLGIDCVPRMAATDNQGKGMGGDNPAG